MENSLITKPTISRTAFWDVDFDQIDFQERDLFVMEKVGTNLALPLGYRISVDIDLFTTGAFNLIEVKEVIAEAFPNAIELTARNQTLLYQINGIKTNLIQHQYPEISEAETSMAYVLLRCQMSSR